jgi:hypothetical protein
MFNYKIHMHDNMLCIKQQDSISLAEIRIFLIVFRFIQNSYARQVYFTALGYYLDFTYILPKQRIVLI